MKIHFSIILFCLVSMHGCATLDAIETKKSEIARNDRTIKHQEGIIAGSKSENAAIRNTVRGKQEELARAEQQLKRAAHKNKNLLRDINQLSAQSNVKKSEVHKLQTQALALKRRISIVSGRKNKSANTSAYQAEINSLERDIKILNDRRRRMMNQARYR